MEPDNHPDPLREAMNHGLQRAMQVVSCAVTAAQVVVYQHKTHARAASERDDRARRALHAQTRGEKEAARAGWAPALDPEWLRQAGLHETAQAWGAAMPYADTKVTWYEPAAATAMRRTEERLRELHPYAMARHDRLRADGLSPAEAMQEAAPLFARSPRARDAPSTPRPVLTAGTGGDEAWVADNLAPASGSPTELAGPEAMELRGQEIVAAMQRRARASGRDPLGDAELRTVLETITNLPDEVIDRVARQTPAGTRARAANPTHKRTTPATASAAAVRTGGTTKPWARDFPLPIREVVAAATTRPTQTAASLSQVSPAPAQHIARTGPGHD